MADIFSNYSSGAGASESGYAGDKVGNSSDLNSSRGYSGYSGYSGFSSSASGSASDDTATDSPPTIVLKLKGAPLEVINKSVVCIFLFVLTASCVGLFIDRVVVRRKLGGSPSDRPRGWVLGMLGSSYMLLVPGLFCNLFAFRIGAMDGFKTFKDQKETMFEFIHELWFYDAYFGVFCVVLFALVVPFLKLVLLVAGGIMRHSGSEERVEHSRRYIHFVQIISKWASPDMFAYILLLYLIRKLNHPPMLNGLFQLDVGFTCFGVFCVFSTLSSLGVRSPPKLPKDLPLKRPSTGRALLTVVTSSAAFWVFWFLGLSTPSMGLALSFSNMVASGQITAADMAIVESLGIAEMAKTDVSIFNAMRDLWTWSFKGEQGNGAVELNTLVAWSVFGIFVIAFTIIDMTVIFLAAIVMHITKSRPRILLELTHICRKLSMLDVCITGVIVIVLAGKSYESMGVMLSLESGVWQLAAAECFHYVAHYTVMAVGGRLPIHKSEAARNLEDLSDSEPSENASTTDGESSPVE